MSALIPVRFKRQHGLYNAGEVAGFSADKVEELLKLEVIDPPAESRFAQSGGQTADVFATPSSIHGSDKFGAVIDLGSGQSVALGEVVRDAHATTGLDADAWNALDQAWRDAAIEKAIEARRVSAEADAESKAAAAKAAKTPKAPAQSKTKPATKPA